MKKYALLIIFSLLFIFPFNVFATSGCCSHHGGVDCSRIKSNGGVVCNDGYMGSTCSYASMKKCNSYRTYTDENVFENNMPEEETNIIDEDEIEEKIFVNTDTEKETSNNSKNETNNVLPILGYGSLIAFLIFKFN